MVWQRLSVRRGEAPVDVLVEGIPPYLKHPLDEWLQFEFGWHRTSARGGVDQSLLRELATVTRIPVHASYEIGGISDQILDAIARDEELYLDVLDATLHLRQGNAHGLKSILELGSSAWTVSADGSGLERRVEEAASLAFAASVAPGDTMSSELNEAWVAAFGREPNPSDAWDHAIKAVEELLIPIVIPKVEKPNLGGVAGGLGSSSHKWTLIPSTSSTTLDDGTTLEAMVRLIWPNPDRHGGGVGRRIPTQLEAERVVHLAVAIVQLCRDGGLSSGR